MRAFRDDRRLLSRAIATTSRFGFHHWLAGSPVGLAETGSLYYGLVVLLQLLPTSTEAATLPRRRRSYFQIQVGE